VYAGTSGEGVFRSDNGGQSWVGVGSGLTNQVVTSLAVDPQVAAVVYAGTTGGGVFRTANGGASWTELNAGLTNQLVTALAVTPAGTCLHAGTQGGGVFDFAFGPASCTPVPVVAAVLPSSRSVQVGAPATAFATIVNSAATRSAVCGISVRTPVPATFSYQTTDPATNALTGTPDTPASIPPGASQSFLIALTPTAAFSPREVGFEFGCTEDGSAPAITGVDTLLLSASTTPVPDIVALAAADGGVLSIAGPVGSGSFAVAAANVGAGGPITAAADTGAAALPIALALCETNPVTGACLAPPAATVARVIGAGETPTFGVFAQATGIVRFSPAVNRVFVRFTDGSGEVRGATSVAVQTR
jgi:hypothetical protein